MDKGRTFLYRYGLSAASGSEIYVGCRVRFGVVQYVAIKPLVTIMTAISKFTKVWRKLHGWLIQFGLACRFMGRINGLRAKHTSTCSQSQTYRRCLTRLRAPS